MDSENGTIRSKSKFSSSFTTSTLSFSNRTFVTARDKRFTITICVVARNLTKFIIK